MNSQRPLPVTIAVILHALLGLAAIFITIPEMTGGVSPDNLVDWFKAGAFAVGAGSNLCPKEYALSGEFEKITEVASKFMAAVKAARA